MKGASVYQFIFTVPFNFKAISSSFTLQLLGEGCMFGSMSETTCWVKTGPEIMLPTQEEKAKRV